MQKASEVQCVEFQINVRESEMFSKEIDRKIEERRGREIRSVIGFALERIEEQDLRKLLSGVRRSLPSQLFW